MIGPKEEWNSLYTESAGNVWQNEREELKNAAMLIHTLTLEFDRIKNEFENKLSTYHNQLKRLDETAILREEANNTLKLTPVDIKKANQYKEHKVLGITPLTTLTTNTLKLSYTSPDLFQCESPDFSTGASKSNENAITELKESPKLNRHKRYYKHKKSKPNADELDCVKKIIVTESSVTPKRYSEDFIEATPEMPSKRRHPNTAGVTKRYKSKVQSKLYNKTLTQIYLPIKNLKENKSDIDAMLCEKSTQKESLDKFSGNTLQNKFCTSGIDATLCKKSTQKEATTKFSVNTLRNKFCRSDIDATDCEKSTQIEARTKISDNTLQEESFPRKKRNNIDAVLLEASRPKVDDTLQCNLKEDSSDDTDATLCEQPTEKVAWKISDETVQYNLKDNRNDIDATLCERTTLKAAGTRISNNVLIISDNNDDDDEITENENDFINFAKNYDKVPNRGKPVEKEKVKMGNFCNRCDKLGVFCQKHIPESQCNLTCTGFWDIDFSVHDPNDDGDSQKSLILL